MKNITTYLLAPVSFDSVPLDVFDLLQLLLLGNDQQPAFQNIQGFVLQWQAPCQKSHKLGTWYTAYSITGMTCLLQKRGLHTVCRVKIQSGLPSWMVLTALQQIQSTS